MTVRAATGPDRRIPADSLVRVAVDDRELVLETALVGDAGATAPLVVFLHEGLGSLAMWRDYPQAFCVAAGVRGLVYSRPGYGRSTRRAPDERWSVNFMHRQAEVVLPALLAVLGIGSTVWLFGHSDGASIALLYAAAFPERVDGVIAVAPHIMVEDLSIASIESARRAYAETDLRDRLARFHEDPDSAFRGWNDIWLDPAFRAWSIEDRLADIHCPVLAIQGEDDQYGTMAQIEGIGRRVAGAQLLKIPACGHSPHRDQPDALTVAAAAFIAHCTASASLPGQSAAAKFR